MKIPKCKQEEDSPEPNKAPASFTKSSAKAAPKNKELIVSFLFSVLSSLFGFAFSFLTAKFLKADGYGQVQYYISIANFMSVFLLFGSRNIVIKNIQFEANKKKYISNYYLLSFASSVIMLPAYFLVAYFLLNKLSHNVLLILIIYLLAMAICFCELIYAFCVGISKNHLKTLLSGIVPHAFFLVIFGIHCLTGTLQLFIDFYIYYSLGIWLLEIIPAFIITFRKGNLNFPKSEIVSHVIFCLIYICYNTKNTLGNIIVGERYQGFNIVGILSISTQMISVAGIFSGIISTITLPVFAKLFKDGDKNRLFKLYETTTRFNMYVNIPFYFAFIAEAGSILSFFGESYTGYDLILVLMATSSLVDCFTGPCGSVLIMSGNEKFDLYTALVQFGTYIALLSWLLKLTDYAVPIAALVSMVVANAMKLVFVSKIFHHNFFSPKIFVPLIVMSAISFCVFYPIGLIQNRIVWAIVNCVVGLSLIASFIFFTPYKKDKMILLKNKFDYDAYLD